MSSGEDAARRGPGRLERAWLALPGNFRGILWISMAALLLAVADVLVKALGRKFDAFEITFFRYASGFVVLAPLFLRMTPDQMRTRRFGLHLARMGFAFVAQVLVVVSVIHLPLADATALMFSKPLFTTVIAVLALREAVAGRRWAATVAGFAGVLVMLRPGIAGVDAAAFAALGAALAFAAANVLIRVLSRTEPTIRILFYYHVCGVAVFSVPAWLGWENPVGVEWLLLVAIGVLTTGAMVGFVRAFSVGEANAVGPAENGRLIYAAALGFLAFSEIPSVWTVAGAALIVASTLFIAREERAAPGGTR